jgi:hypothetical protein
MRTIPTQWLKVKALSSSPSTTKINKNIVGRIKWWGQNNNGVWLPGFPLKCSFLFSLKLMVNSLYLFGFDDRPFQFNFTSDLVMSNFSICRKQRKSQDKLRRGLLMQKYKPYTRTRTIRLSSIQQIHQWPLELGILGVQGIE